MIWTIAYNGVEKTLADWGLTDVVRRLISQGIDELSFKADGQPMDDEPIFEEFADTLVLYRDRQVDVSGNFSGGTPWFSGIVTKVPRAGDPEAEKMTYKVAGPWWYLDNLVFLQPWQQILLTIGSGGAPVLGPSNSSHLYLNLHTADSFSNFNITKITTGQQIIAALNWCLQPFVAADSPPPFQIGRVTPALDVPIDEVHDISCGEVIRKMLRWSPDAVAYFDYTTTPPTFNVLRRADMATVNIDVSTT